MSSKIDIPSFTEHQKPAEGAECACTFDDITEENYCEYQTAPSMTWHPARYSAEVVQQLLDTQWSKFTEGVAKADCAAELRRWVQGGPPIWIQDATALPVPEGDTHVCALWTSSDNVERSAKITGCLEGEEREKLWAQQKECLKAMESANAASAEDGGPKES